MEVKKCSKCKEKKNLSEFTKNRRQKDGLSNYCKICDNKRKAIWRLKSKSQIKKYAKKYHAKQRGFTVAEREQFIILRGSCCEICGKARNFSKEFLNTDLCVDHCHITNENKGVLCRPCNLAAGSLDDNSDRAFKLWKYLERTREIN